MKTLSFYILNVLPSLTAGSWSSDYWIPGKLVKTQSGLVQGRLASEFTQVSAYLGIPYAKPPLDDLRFEVPEKFEGHSVVDGTKFGFSCPISSMFGGGAAANLTNKNFTAAGVESLDLLLQTGDAFSEDCLTLNVWTKPQVGERKKAVMVWIYGGGFTAGRASDPTYDAQFIVDQEDVIVVSINYRMNIFGFPGNPNGPLNPGLLDQRLAIEWIRDNIAAFGGDPARITLFGQSAGAGSVDFYSYAYLHDPIISGMILESGTTALGAYPLESTADSWYNVTATLGCGDVDTNQGALMACMRSKSTQEITDAIPLFDQAFASAAFWPTIDNVSVFSDYPARTAAGNFIKVPLLVGNNDFEAGYFRAMASLYNDFLPDDVWVEFSNATFSCPAAIRANASCKAGIPTWRYRYFGTFEELRLTTEPDSGSYHGSELSVLFGTVNETGMGSNASAGVNKVGRYMRGAWAAFANDPSHGLSYYDGGWAKYDPGKETLLKLAYENGGGVLLADPSLYDSACK